MGSNSSKVSVDDVTNLFAETFIQVYQNDTVLHEVSQDVTIDTREYDEGVREDWFQCLKVAQDLEGSSKDAMIKKCEVIEDIMKMTVKDILIDGVFNFKNFSTSISSTESFTDTKFTEKLKAIQEQKNKGFSLTGNDASTIINNNNNISVQTFNEILQNTIHRGNYNQRLLIKTPKVDGLTLRIVINDFSKSLLENSTISKTMTDITKDIETLNKQKNDPFGGLSGLISKIIALVVVSMIALLVLVIVAKALGKANRSSLKRM